MRRAIAALLLAWSASWPLSAPAADWAVEHGDSRLGFTAWWEGQAFDGVFRRWRAETLRFDPDDPAHSYFDIRVDLTSADTDSADRDEALAEPEWFGTAHPTARYETTGFTRRDDGRYEARGTLTLKGVTRPVNLDLTWRTTGDTATLAGTTRLERTRFNVGTGDWQAGEVIALEVKVSFDLKLKLRPGA